MILREFLKLYNFRHIQNQKENTQIIRIYTDWPSKWFEFGVNDWDYNNNADKLIEEFLTKDVLDQEVISFNYDYENEVVAILVEVPEPPESSKIKKETQ